MSKVSRLLSLKVLFMKTKDACAGQKNIFPAFEFPVENNCGNSFGICWLVYLVYGIFTLLIVFVLKPRRKKQNRLDAVRVFFNQN